MERTTGQIAEELRKTLDDLSPLIEERTARTCPGCTDVCCREKHGRPTAIDWAYFAALGIRQAEQQGENRPLDGPCSHLRAAGCDLPRWQRAWKCTWYFCDPLLNALGEGSQKTSRRIAELLNRAMALREELECGPNLKQ